MRFEHSSGFRAELREGWTYGDLLHVRQVARGEGGAEAASLAIIQRVVTEWSLPDQICLEAIQALPADLGDQLYAACVEAAVGGDADPKAATRRGKRSGGRSGTGQ